MPGRFPILFATLLALCTRAMDEHSAWAQNAEQTRIFWTYQSPDGADGGHVEDLLTLPDGSLALTVSEAPDAFYLYRLDATGHLTQRIYLGVGGSNTIVDRALSAVLPPLAALDADARRVMNVRDVPVVVANSHGQAWRVAPDGRIEWFAAAGPTHGLWLTASMRTMADGSVLLGGRGEVDGGRSCSGAATIVRLGPDGQTQWRWRFELPMKWTYVTQILVRDDDTIVALVDTAGPDMGSASNPCLDRSQSSGLHGWPQTERPSDSSRGRITGLSARYP
jgi:hypothetical protein